MSIRLTTCKACNVTGSGMINIYEHPNNVDSMYSCVSGIEQININDALCIPCYDDLKIAYNFKQKCIQTNLLRRNGESKPSIKCVNRSKTPSGGIAEALPPNVEPIHSTIASEDEKETTDVVSSANVCTNQIQCDESMSVLDFSDEQNNDADISEGESIPPTTVDSPSNKAGAPDAAAAKLEVSTTVAVFTCNDCGKTFNRIGNLRRHERTLHFRSNLAAKASKERAQRKAKQNANNDDNFGQVSENQCEFCFKHFESLDDRKSHEVDHKSEEKPYRCTFEKCSSQFKERFGLRKHFETHSNIKRYKCRYCDQRFHQRGNAMSHERLHTGEKPYICDHCGKSFAESGNLKAHIRFHTGDRPYKCPECPKRFTTHYSHKIHIRTHTKERPYLCNDCGKRFSSSGKLLVHKRIHSGHRPYRCDVCAAAFVDSSGLKRHAKIH